MGELGARTYQAPEPRGRARGPANPKFVLVCTSVEACALLPSPNGIHHYTNQHVRARHAVRTFARTRTSHCHCALPSPPLD